MEYTQAQADKLRLDAERLEMRARDLPVYRGEWMVRQAQVWRKQAQEIEKHLPAERMVA